MDVVKIKTDVLLQKVADEMVLLAPSSGEYFTLNEVGTIIVEHSQQGKIPVDIAQHLSDLFNVDENQALQDVNALLNQLVEQGLAESL